MSRATQTPAVPAIARLFHADGQLTEIHRRHLWDGAIRRNRPESELRWLCGEEARSLGFSLADNCSINLNVPGTLSPLGAAVRTRKVAAVRTLLDEGAPRSPQPEEPNFLTLLLSHVPDKAKPTTALLAALQQGQVALDVPGHGSPLLAAINRANFTLVTRFPLVAWLDALAPLGLAWESVTGENNNTLLHELARGRMKPELMENVLARMTLTPEMFDVRNDGGRSPLDELNARSAFDDRHPIWRAYERCVAGQRAELALDRVALDRLRAPRHRP